MAEKSKKKKTPEEKREADRQRRLSNRRRKALEELEHPNAGTDEGLIYGTKQAAEVLGVGTTILKKHVSPRGYADNPRFRHAGSPVGLYDPRDLLKAKKKPAVADAISRFAKRSEAAQSGANTRGRNMAERMREAEITIIRGKTVPEIHKLAISTHGGNYHGGSGEFHWSNRTAHNCIRHNLTNYESLWKIFNRGETGEEAYTILRERVDDLIDEAYPQFAGTEEEE